MGSQFPRAHHLVWSHRIVGFLDRTIGCDFAKVRPIGNICYDLQQRSDAAIDQSWYLRPIVRLVVPPVAKSCDKSGQVASSCTTKRDVVRRVAPPTVRWHDLVVRQIVIIIEPRSSTTGRATMHEGRAITLYLTAIAFDLESQARSFEHDHRTCCD